MPKFNQFKTFAAVMMAASLGAVTSCVDYSEFTEAEIREIELMKQYKDAFEARFGKIDPNHTWGMDEEIGAIGAFSEGVVTRAGRVEVNRNQWTEWNNDPSQGPTGLRDEKWEHSYGTVDMKVPNFKKSALGHDIQIPGYPHLNGLYYVANGNTLDPDYRTGDGRNGSKQIKSGDIPAGDVTPYEIQYVSAWFRTHKIENPEDYRLNLHLSDFFIQNVSCDFDQVEYTDLSTPYETGWNMTGKNGKNIGTKNEAIYENGQTTPRLGFDKEGKTVNYVENLTENISYELDYLGFKDMNNEWTHVNNFNRGNSNFSPEDNLTNANREIKFIKSSGTEDFKCRSSWSNSKYIEDSEWVLVRLTWVETVKHTNSPYELGTKIPREGYYLAFDFAGGKQGGQGDQIVHRDGYFSNWIIKITPAHFNPAGNVRRIFCENVGALDDIDFNDAVVDVAFEQVSGGYQSIISVQATGATRPLWVEQEGEDYELHKMLGYDNTTAMINVGRKETGPIATYRGKTYSSTNAGQIKLVVVNQKVKDANGVEQKMEITGKDADKNSDERTGNITDYKNESTGKAPMAFSAPTTVKWMLEREHIEDGYKSFPDWVRNAAENTTWYAQNNEGTNVIESKLYTPTFKPEDDHPTGGGSQSGDKEDLEWSPIVPDPDAATVVATVKADSYMKLNGYTLEDAIIKRLNNMDNDGRVTFTVVLSSNNQYIQNGQKLEGILIPADINDGSLSNNGQTFTTGVFKRFTSAAYVPNDNISDKDYQDKNTYTLQFSLSKSDILNSAHTDPVNPYHDYLLLYLRVGGNDSTVGTSETLGVNSGVTVQKWFVHY